MDSSRICSINSLGSKRFRGAKSEERGFRRFARAKNGARAKIGRTGGGGELRKRLRTNPLILKTSVRQRTELVIGWASQTLLTCVDQRS